VRDVNRVGNNRLTRSGRPRSRFSRMTSSKKVPPLDRLVEDLGQAHLHLPQQQLVLVTGAAVERRERPRQALRPAVEEGLDLLGTQGVADPLPPVGSPAGDKAVVEGLESDPLPAQLLLGPSVLLPRVRRPERPTTALVGSRRSFGSRRAPKTSPSGTHSVRHTPSTRRGVLPEGVRVSARFSLTDSFLAGRKVPKCLRECGEL
jgi:hypothetical protein